MIETPTIGTNVFVRFTGDATGTPENPAHRGSVITLHGMILIAKFTESLHCVPGEVADIQFATEHARWVAEAQVQAKLCSEAQPMVRFHLAHEPVVAERRRCVRVSTAAADLYARVGDCRDCHVLNVSAEGMAVVMPSTHHAGDMVPVVIRSDDDDSFAGLARIAHCELRRDGRCRCGLDVSASQRSLLNGLQKLVTSIQRQQLQRVGCLR